MKGFKILKAGIYTTIQDKGRFSFMHLGVTNSGFMDEYAANACNKLLNNTLDTNLLEILFPILQIKVTQNTTIAITGAKCEFFINEKQKKTWESYFVKVGDEIKILKILEGQRIYLGVKGGFLLEKEFGSYATCIKEGFGGINGQKLLDNDILLYKKNNDFIKRKWKKQYVPMYKKELTLRVILSYQYDIFEKKQVDKFFSSEYTITSDFNCMACKLNGEAIECTISNLISEAIAFGSIQIPKDGKPIILLKERQTIGGYAKIGSVLSLDCFKLAQMKIGSKIRFEEISLNKAQQKVLNFSEVFY